MLSKVIGFSPNRTPIVAKISGIMEVPEEKSFQVIYSTSELINGVSYNEKQNALKVELQRGTPMIKGRGPVTVETPNGKVTDPEIKDIPATADKDNYNDLLNAYKTGEQYNFVLAFIEANHK